MPALCHLLLLLSCCALDSATEEGKYTLYIYQFVVNTSFTRFYLSSVVLFNCSQVELVYNMSLCGHIYSIYVAPSNINLYIFSHNKAYQICPNTSITRFTRLHPFVNSQVHVLFTHNQTLREIALLNLLVQNSIYELAHHFQSHNNLRNRVIELQIVSEESLERRHSLSNSEPQNVTAKEKNKGNMVDVSNA